MKRLAAVLLGLLLLWGCGSNSSNSTAGNTNLTFISSTLANRASRAGTPCSVTYDTTTVNGTCYTPTRVSGYFSQATIGKVGGGAPARIVGGGSGAETSGLVGNFYKSSFDLKTSPKTASTEDNLEGSSGPYGVLSLTVHMLETEFLAQVANKVYRVRVPFAITPPSSSSVYSTCDLGTSQLAEVDTAGTLLGTGVTAQAGDILVCIKNATTETCADTDYQWVTSTGTLTATRPTTPAPKRLSGAYLMTADSCTAGSRPEITWGNASLDVLLSSTVDITAAFGSGGKKTYTSGSTSGSKLAISLDVVSTNSLFVPGVASGGLADLNAASESDILNAIENIAIKPVYLKNKKGNSASATDESMTATATITITE